MLEKLTSRVRPCLGLVGCVGLLLAGCGGGSDGLEGPQGRPVSLATRASTVATAKTATTVEMARTAKTGLREQPDLLARTVLLAPSPNETARKPSRAKMARRSSSATEMSDQLGRHAPS